MKYFNTLILIVLFTSAGLSQVNQENENHAIYPPDNFAKSFPEEYSALLLFTNINLSNETAPQNEPSIRISRVNPNYVVAAWRDFRLGYTSNVVRRIGYSYSTNGGISWSVSQLLPDPNPNHTSQSDPVVTSDAQGHFYISSTSRQPVSGYNREMLIYKSTNNGQTFFYHSTAVPGSGGGGEDKEWIFCDPVTTNSTYNNIFITWTSFGSSTGIKFRKSSNSGLNWTSTVNVGDNTSGQGSNVCSGTNNQIYVVWDASGIRFDKSTNGGVSFGTDYQLSSISATNGFPFICADYSNRSSRGNVYVVWDDNRGGNYDVYFQRSTNAGSTWLASPVRINDVTTNNQYWPAVQCDTNGYLYAIYYDTRFGSTQVNSFIAYSTNLGDTWTNQRLSDTSFTVSQPNSDVRFGDYIGIDVYKNVILPIWTDQRRGGYNQEIYTSYITGIVSVTQISSEIPEKFILHQNYPNPFNPNTKIKFEIPKRSFINLRLHDIQGRIVLSLISKTMEAGIYEIPLDASNLSSGAYFYQMNSDDVSITKKLLIIK